MDQSVQSFAGTAARGSAIATPVEGMVTYLNDINSLSVYNGTAFTTDRTIQVFAGTAARGSAIGTAVEGMYTHINDTDSLEYYDGSAWVAAGGGGAILQVVSTTKTDVFTTASGTYTDVTGLSVSITPSSATNKLLIFWGLNVSHTSTNGNAQLILTDGSDNVLVQGDADGVKTRVTEGSRNLPAIGAGTMEIITNFGNSFLYSPATTSAVTLKFRAKTNTGTFCLNRNGVFNNDDANALPVSSLTVMEVVA
jgi:hypothetical protein